MTSSDKDISIAKTITIVTLGPEQRLRLEGTAKLGIGRKHAKFQAGIVSYGEEKDGIHFMVESFYQMEPIDVISRGCDAIQSQIEAVEEALGVPSKKKKVKVEKAEKAEKAEKPEKKEKKAKKKKSEEPAEEKSEAAEEKKEE